MSLTSSFFDPFNLGSSMTNDPFFRTSLLSDPFFRTTADPFFRSNRLMGGQAGTTGRGLLDTDFIPLDMDVYETDRGYLIRCDVPGLNKEDIKLNIQQNVLTIEGVRKLEEKEKNATMYLSERSFGRFSRSFRLPTDTNVEKVDAKVDAGVLSVSLDKIKGTEGGQGRRSVKID